MTSHDTEVAQPGHVNSLSRPLLDIILASLEDHKAEEPVVIELEGKSAMADQMVIASGQSARHVAAMADNLVETLHEAGVRPVLSEGRTAADWVLIDAGDVIVHLFRPEVRSFYNLEKMWGHEMPARRLAAVDTVSGWSA